MATNIIMPKQGLLMDEGVLVKWLVSEGQKIEKGQPLFEMETDKTNMEIQSDASGTLLKILAKEGESVPVGETIGIIGEPEEDVSALISQKSINIPAEQIKKENENLSEKVINEDSYNNRVFITPRAKKRAQEMGVNYNEIKGSGPDGLIIEKDILNLTPENDKIKATPVAKKIAELKGIDLNKVEGTGINGRIKKVDIETMAEKSQSFKVASQTGKLIPFRGMRKIIADRMIQSLHNAAQANHRMKVDMTEIIALRGRFKEAGKKISYTDIFIKIASLALKENPMMNATLTDEGILLLEDINIGIAVEVDNGLVVPVLRNADKLSLEEIEKKSKKLIEKARAGQLIPDEMFGGTFTITNLGMYEIDSFTAILNPPETGILAIGSINEVPVVDKNRDIVIKPILELSLTYDHRVIDGAPAARFLQTVKRYIENPLLML